MNFLAPLFLFGTLAIALPVVFHLIRRTTREQTPFSTLMFLRPTPPRVTRRSRLDNILLLILRCLVLCLLALGFARPFLKKPVAAAPDRGGKAKTILLVDFSASMRRENLWNEAVNRAEGILRKLGPSDEVAVFGFDHQVRTLIGFSQWATAGAGERVALAVNRLQEIKPGWGATSLGQALVAAAETFEETDKKEHVIGLRRVILISDVQEGSKLDGLQGFEWPRGVEVVVESVRPKKPTNAGIQLLATMDEATEESGGTKVRVRVSNSSDASREQFQIRWANGSTNTEIYVPPGQSRTLPLSDSASESGNQLVLLGDDADFDNTIHAIAPKTDELRILFLGQDPASDSTQALYYLKRAFQETRRQTVSIIARSNNELLNPSDLAGTQLIVVSDELPENRFDTVRQMLSEGKTVLLTMKTVSSANTLGRLLGLANIAAEEANSPNYAMLGQIDFQHPLFAPFADPRFSDFTKIHFWKHRRLNPTQFPSAHVLARFDGPEADPAILQIPVAKGNIYALTFGWFPADSQFALSSKFVPLLYSLLEQSGAIKVQTSQYTVGDSVDVAAFQSSEPIVIRRPDGTEAQTAPGERFTQTDLPGIYTVESAQTPVRFAVNLAAEESKTAPLAIETLERLGVPLRIQATQTEKQVQRAAAARQHVVATELENRQKLWRWLLVAALVVLMMETWLAGRLTRRSALQTEVTI